jgi:hypothetical protein
MWTAFVLVCTQNFCFAVGGPGHASEQDCYADLMNNGLPSLQRKYVSSVIVNLQCYNWGERKQES